MKSVLKCDLRHLINQLNLPQSVISCIKNELISFDFFFIRMSFSKRVLLILFRVNGKSVMTLNGHKLFQSVNGKLLYRVLLSLFQQQKKECGVFI